MRISPLLIALCVLVVYGSLGSAQFTHWDDNLNVWQNPHYLPVSWENTLFFWRESYNQTYRPLVHTFWAALALVSQSNGPQHIPGGGATPFDARVFHLANLLIHLVNALLVFALLRRWVKREAAAIGGALLFAVHPLQVESVVWVTGFNEVLCGLFCLLSLKFFFEFRDQSASLKRSYALAALFYFLALLTKPAAVALPLVLWVFDFCLVKQSFRASLRVLWPFLVGGALWSIVTARVHPDTYAGLAPALWTRPFLAGDVWTFYLQKLLLPFNLAIDYGRKPDVVLQNPFVWLVWLIPALLLMWAWKIRHKSPAPLLGLGVFLAWTLPVCGLKPFHFQLQYSLVADRYLYFALVGLSFWLALWLDGNFNRFKTALLSGAMLLWATLSFFQAQTWRDNFSLFEQAIRVNGDSWLAHANLGAAYANENQTARAVPHWKRALEINPQLWQMQVSLARYFENRGEKSAALAHWKAALQINPSFEEARQALSLPQR